MEYWTGKYKDFYWFEVVSGNELTLGELCILLPELFLEKYLAVAYFDGGAMTPSDQEEKNGWRKDKEITYSPILTSRELELPICDNFDQWYLFTKPTAIPDVIDYVNHINFSLQENVIEWESLQNSFWNHIELVNPYSFVLDGTRLIYVSKNQSEVEKVKSLGTTIAIKNAGS